MIFQFILLSLIFQSISSTRPLSELASLSKTFQKDDEITLYCSAKQGTLPVTFEWFHRGQPIQSEDNLSILNLSKKTSTLTVKSASIEHGGVFSCKVTNEFDSSTSSIEINVEGNFRLI